MHRPPQLVLLDVDFTLIRPHRVFDANGYAELGARFGIRLDPERYEAARQAAFHVWQVETLEHRSAQHRRFATEIVRGMGAPRAVAEQIGIAAEQEWGDPSNFELFPDVLPLLDVLRASPCTVGLVSNTDRELELFAAQLGIGVDFALASHAHGRRKPCATIFAAALALGGAQPADAVMVGDNLSDDIEGAHRERAARRARRSQRPPSGVCGRARARARRAAPAARPRDARGDAVRPARRQRVAPRAFRAGRRASSRHSSARCAATSYRADASARGSSSRSR